MKLYTKENSNTKLKEHKFPGVGCPAYPVLVNLTTALVMTTIRDHEWMATCTILSTE